MRGLCVVGAVLVMLVAGCARAPVEPAPVAAAPGGLVAAAVGVPAGLGEEPFDVPRRVLVPPGWTFSVWARVPGARLAAWAPDRTLLVSRPDDGEVDRLTPGPGGATSQVLLRGLDQPHGLAFDGDTLYVAQSDQIDTYHYAAGTASFVRTLVDGLPDAKSAELGGQYAHALKTVVISPDKSVYFSIGSSGNISAEDREATPQRATIMRLPPGQIRPEVFALGVRNGTGLAIAPDGSVWTAVNNRDNVGYPRDGGRYRLSRGDVDQRYVADHPPEELARLTPGRDLGWPYCNPDPHVDAPDPDRAPGFINDVQTNPDGGRQDCARLAPIERTFGAHSAPLGLAFATLPAPYGTGALVGIHGSWNRTPPRAPEVSFFPWSGRTLGSQRTLVGGFQAADGSRWGRPVAALPGPDGAVYITDDQAGAVYRLAPDSRR
jgi:glucose/arabinose dehydrogenase